MRKRKPQLFLRIEIKNTSQGWGCELQDTQYAPPRQANGRMHSQFLPGVSCRMIGPSTALPKQIQQGMNAAQRVKIEIDY